MVTRIARHVEYLPRVAQCETHRQTGLGSIAPGHPSTLLRVSNRAVLRGVEV